MDTSSSNTVEIIENQILKAINRIKYISKKRCTLKIYNYLQNHYASNFDYHSVEAKLNELKASGIIDDSYKIINPIQEVMNFVTEDEVIICSENSEDEPNDSQRTVTPTKIIGPEITTQVVNKSTTEYPKESDINVIKGQLQNLENKLVGKILALKSYFMDEILSLKDQIKDYKTNGNVQELSIEKSKDLILLRERVKYLESESKFLKDDIFNKQKLIDKLLENNNKLVDFRSHHVPVQYIQDSQRGSVNGSRSSNGMKYKPVDDNSPQIKLKENKNPIHKENHGVVNSASEKEIIIVGDSMIKHVNGCEVSRDNSVKIRCHPGATTDDIIDYVRPTARKKPDMIIIHTGTNDIQNKVNTLEKVRKVITTITEIDVNNEIQITFSSVIHRNDQDFEEEIKEINRKLENLCKGKGIKFINNTNIYGSCLNRSKLHLNKSGTALLVKNFSQALKPN